jgi:hypothetical protein
MFFPTVSIVENDALTNGALTIDNLSLFPYSLGQIPS